MPVTARLQRLAWTSFKSALQCGGCLFSLSWLFLVVWDGMFKLSNIHMRISLFLWSFCTECSTCFTHFRLKIMQWKWCCPQIQKLDISDADPHTQTHTLHVWSLWTSSENTLEKPEYQASQVSPHCAYFIKLRFWSPFSSLLGARHLH